MVNKKIKFILYFIISFIVFLFIGLKVLAQPLIHLQVLLIKIIFGSFFNYLSFVFVPECSGIVSISAYLSIILAFKLVKIKASTEIVLKSVLFLFIINIIRLIVVLFSEKISFVFAEIVHIISWFIIAVIIFWLVIKSKY